MDFSSEQFLALRSPSRLNANWILTVLLRKPLEAVKIGNASVLALTWGAETSGLCCDSGPSKLMAFRAFPPVLNSLCCHVVAPIPADLPQRKGIVT